MQKLRQELQYPCNNSGKSRGFSAPWHQPDPRGDQEKTAAIMAGVIPVALKNIAVMNYR